MPATRYQLKQRSCQLRHCAATQMMLERVVSFTAPHVLKSPNNVAQNKQIDNTDNEQKRPRHARTDNLGDRQIRWNKRAGASSGECQKETHQKHD